MPAPPWTAGDNRRSATMFDISGACGEWGWPLNAVFMDAVAGNSRCDGTSMQMPTLCWRALVNWSR
eukprot:12234894-Karenia_brevis.AAC.1